MRIFIGALTFILLSQLQGCASLLTKPPTVTKAEIKHEERVQLQLLGAQK